MNCPLQPVSLSSGKVIGGTIGLPIEPYWLNADMHCKFLSVMFYYLLRQPLSMDGRIMYPHLHPHFSNPTLPYAHHFAFGCQNQYAGKACIVTTAVISGPM